MEQPGHEPRVFGFGVFELDRHTGELRRSGVKLPLQEQPLRLLGLLLDRAGDLVSREEIVTQLWPGDAFGDLDHRLNNAVNKIRLALGDSAENPRFLETIPRRGYRFVGSVTVKSSEPESAAVIPEVNPGARRHRWTLAIGALLLLS